MNDNEAPLSHCAVAPKEVDLKVTVRGNPQDGEGPAAHEFRGEQLQDAIIFLMMRRQAVMRVVPDERLGFANHRGGIPQMAVCGRSFLPQLCAK